MSFCGNRADANPDERIDLVATGSNRFKQWIASIAHTIQLRADAEQMKLRAETQELEARAQLTRAKAYRELGEAVKALRESGYEVTLITEDGCVPHILIHRDPVRNAQQPVESIANDDEIRTTDDRFAYELARIVWDRDTAATLLLGIGFPREQMPRDGTPRWFWSRVVEELRNGMYPGIHALAERAAALYPGNSVFQHVAHRRGVP